MFVYVLSTIMMLILNMALIVAYNCYGLQLFEGFELSERAFFSIGKSQYLVVMYISLERFKCCYFRLIWND